MKKAVISYDIAWDGNPVGGNIHFNCIVPNQISKAIIQSLKPVFNFNSDEIVINSLKAVKDCAGHYKLSFNNHHWFVKVLKREHGNYVIEDLILSYLASKGFKVNLPLLSNIPLMFINQTYSIWVYPFISGRHFNGSLKDLKNLSEHISELHNVLRNFKFADIVKKNTETDARQLDTVRKKMKIALYNNHHSFFLGYKKWSLDNKRWLLQLVDEFDPYFHKWLKPQCLHGELHVGNVIFTHKTNDIALVDFEESPCSWYTTLYDIAFLIQRFCANSDNDMRLFKKRIKIIESVFGPFPVILQKMLKHICWKKIMTIFESRLNKNYIVPISELDKFIKLDRQTTFFLS